MGPKLLMFGVGIFLLGTILSQIMAGAGFSATDASIMNDLQVIRVAKVTDTWSVPVLNINFFTRGIWSVMHWDWSFLSGSYLMWVFYLLNIGIVWGIFMVIVGVIQSLFSSR